MMSVLSSNENAFIWALSVLLLSALLVGTIVAVKQKNSPNVLDEKVLKELQNLPAECNTVHLIVLVPGLLSPRVGMTNSRLALERLAEEANKKDPSFRIVVYRANFNLGWKTTDGIFICGERLATEINLLVSHISSNRKASGMMRVNLSIAGNSLGGLIGRAALPDIIWSPQDSSSKVTVVPKAFYTTNTPHLGSRDAMHVELPAVMQYFAVLFLSVVLRDTGKDLFRYTTCIDTLAADEKYTNPLSKFDKRMAFANTYRTDYQVATGTGVFLAPDSDSIHQSLPSFNDNFPFVVQAVSTPRLDSPARNQNRTSKDKVSVQQQWMRYHSEKLDSLGWTKVFCDARPVLPSVKFPSIVTKLWKSSIPEGRLDSLEKQQEWTAAQLHQKYCRDDPAAPCTWYIPLAHRIIMANVTKVPGAEYFSQKGLPFVEAYANRIVQDLLE